MPIHISEYDWHQNNEKIMLNLDLRRTSPKNVDIMYTNAYLKVSYSPYIFEVFLTNDIDTEKSVARILPDHIELTLYKCISQPWESVSRKVTRAVGQELRQEALRCIEEQQKKAYKKKKDEANERERFAISSQLQLDDKHRQEMKNAVEKEKEAFFSEPSVDQDGKECFQETQHRRLSSTCSEDGLNSATSEADYDGDWEDNLHYSSNENISKKTETSGDTRKETAPIATGASYKTRKSVAGRKANKKDKKVVLPPVRTNSTIKVTHTPRVFPTPARESNKQQEEEWIRKNCTNTFKDTKGEEECVDFYKDKAVKLFSSGDYQGCVNAYTCAIASNSNQASLYSNRAAAHIALNNLHHAIADCTKALDLLIPVNSSNTRSRLLCHVRRGTALAHLQLYKEGLVEYQAALALDPSNETIANDADKIRAIMNITTDTAESDEEEEEEEKEEGGKGGKGKGGKTDEVIESKECIDRDT